jgi:hypothetical protein
MDASATGDRLTPHEDHELRRLHWFEGFGCELSGAVQLLKTSLRTRDRRDEIRAPATELDRDAADAPRVSNEGYWIRFLG